MEDKDWKDLVMAHDKDIVLISQSMKHIASAVEETNESVKDMVIVMSKQLVMDEKFRNMEENLVESFARVHKTTRVLEKDSNARLSPVMMRWILGLIITYNISMGAYLMKGLHSLETRSSLHIATQKILHDDLDMDISELDSNVNRNYGQILGMKG